MQNRLKIIFFCVAILLFLILYYFPKNQEEYLTNTTDLYSLFTPYMKNYVDCYLDGINCSPEKYYYNNSKICFICDDIVSCFDYLLIERGGKQKINPHGISLEGKFKKEDEINFYSLGISKMFNCKFNEKYICEKGIEMKFNDSSKQVAFIFPKNMTNKEIKNEIEYKMKEKDINCNFINPYNSTNISSFSCGYIKGNIVFNEVYFVI